MTKKEIKVQKALGTLSPDQYVREVWKESCKYWNTGNESDAREGIALFEKAVQKAYGTNYYVEYWDGAAMIFPRCMTVEKPIKRKFKYV